MSRKHLIAIADLCVYHEVEYTFINDLNDAGLVEITIVNKAPHIDESDLKKLEKMIRLHHELDINVAGIEAITHLLNRMELLHEDMRIMRNRLLFFEENQ